MVILSTLLTTYAPTKLIALAFGLLIFLMVIWNLLLFIFYGIKRAYFAARENWQLSHLREIDSRFMSEEEKILLSKFPYFKGLSTLQRKRFLIRLNSFKRDTQIVGAEGLELTEEMRTLISASAIQLTFGLESYWLGFSKVIIVHPDIFHNSMLDQYHKGETNMKGRIRLSWKHFLEGYQDGSDKLNLGLHELAHALDLSRVFDDSDYHFKAYFEKWQLIAKEEYTSMQEYTSFLRDYASTNFREFFAVCVEHFFEAPKDFKEHLPEIYKHMTMLLRQDPLKSIEESEAERNLMDNLVTDSDIQPPPLYSTRISLWGSAIASMTLVLRTVITLFVFILAFKSGQILVILIVAFLVAYFNALLFTKFEMYNNHLVFKRPYFFNQWRAFHYDNIISVSFFHEKTDNVRITYVENGDITSFNAMCSVSTADEQELLKKLAEKKIITRALYQ
jgi:Mlc titration factor MtfA (ptsG expression regulator)